ncbi:MAG: hypothetical protein ACI4QV_03040, partial [Acutalibacteraceae bacterium]
MKKIWHKLFLSVSVIFMAFTAVIAVVNACFLSDYYLATEKKQMKNIAEQIDGLDYNSDDSITLLNETEEY